MAFLIGHLANRCRPEAKADYVLPDFNFGLALETPLCQRQAQDTFTHSMYTALANQSITQSERLVMFDLDLTHLSATRH